MPQLNSQLHHLAFFLFFFLIATTNSNAESFTIPKNTKIRISLQTDIDSNTCESGDNFSAEVFEDVFVDNKMVLPIGTKIYGVVIVWSSYPNERNSCVRLHFSSIKSSSGIITRLPANLIVRGSIVTFRRDDKDIKIDAANPFFRGAL